MNHTGFPFVLCVILYFSLLTRAEIEGPFITEDFDGKTFSFMNEECIGVKPFKIYEYEEGDFSKPDGSNNFYAGADGSVCSQSYSFLAEEGTDVEVMFSVKKYAVGDAFDVSFVDANKPDTDLVNYHIDIESAINSSIIQLVMQTNQLVKVKMNATSIRLDRIVAVDYVKVHKKGSPCIGSTTIEPEITTEDPSETTETTPETSTQTTEESTSTDGSVGHTTDRPEPDDEFEKLKVQVNKWISISTVAIVVSVASITMSTCVCMFHVKSPTNYECRDEEESVVVQTGVSRMASNS